MNNINDINESTNNLATILGNKYNDLDITYRNAVDYSNGFYLDLMSVLQQEVDAYQDQGLTWENVTSIFFDQGPVGVLASIVEAIQADISQALASATINLINQFNDVQNTLVATVGSHIELYKSELDNYQRVLVIAHSQGTLYANVAYEAVMMHPEYSPDSMGIVSVAALVSYIADGHNGYVTSSNDLAVNLLRASVAPDILSANATVPVSTDDLKGHAFRDIYISDWSPTKDMIVNLGHQRLDELSNHDWVAKQPLRSYTAVNVPYPWCLDGEGNLQNTPASFAAAAPEAYVHALETIVSSAVTGVQPDYASLFVQSQTYRNPNGNIASAQEFADGVGDSATVSDVNALDVNWASTVNVALYADYPAVASCHLQGQTSSFPAGTTIDNAAQVYDTTYLKPELTAIEAHDNVLSAKVLSDWPNKRVEVKVCAARPQAQ